MSSKTLQKLNKSLKNFKNEYKSFIRNTSWTTMNQLVNIIFGVLLSVIFARLTSQELFGQYNFLNSVVAIISITAIPGFNTSMMRSISRGMDGVYKKAVKLSFMWSLLGVPILFLIGSYYYFFSNQIVGLGLFVAAILFPLIYAPNNWIALLQGKMRFDIFAKYSIIQTMIRTMAIILAIYLDRNNLILIFLSYLITSAATNVFFYFKCKQYLRNDEEEKGWKWSGYKLTFNDFVALSYDNVDKIIIGIFLGPVELAIYSIAVSIVSALKVSLIQIVKVISPSIYTMTKKTLKIRLRKTFPFLVISNLIILALIVSFMPFITTLLYSEKYVDSIIFAQVYSLTIPLSVLMGVLSSGLISLKEENLLLTSRLVGFVLIIPLYAIMIPYLGIMGAILASIIYYIVLCLLQYFYLRRKFHSG